MLVLLKVEVDRPLPVPEWAPRDQLQVGQTVIALGKTFDATQANLSVGILSAVNRIWGKAVQTDANISPTNYGGPLIDLYGRVVGVLVPLSPESTEEVAGAEWYDSGIGFAVPISTDDRHFEQLKNGEDLWPGKLGIAFEGGGQLDPETKLAVVQVNSPAASAGLQPGDRIREVNGRAVERQSEFRHVIGPLYAGDSIEMSIERGDEKLELAAKLTDIIPPYEHAFLGVLPTRRDAGEGVDVRFVYPESAAANADIQAGDRITQLNEVAVQDAVQLRGLLANLQPEQKVRLAWQRAADRLDAELVLTRLPSSVPESLPTPHPADEVGKLTTGKIPVEIPEEPNRCNAFIPDSLKAGGPPGLLVLLPRPGESDVDGLIDSCASSANRTA